MTIVRDMIRINQPVIGKEEIDAVVDVLKSGILTEKSGMGPKVLEFERNFAKFVEAKNAIAISSGTAALHSALMVSGVGPDDEVIIPSFTFPATAGVVLMTGATPVFADIDEHTYCMTTEAVESVLSRKTKAMIIVDLYGLPADLDPLLKLAHDRGITTIEDAAQAHGASYNGRKIGSLCEITCFSFYAGKNMTTGEGGMITTNDDDITNQLRMVRSHGEQRPYWVARLGHNYRMTEIAAAIGVAQLRKLPQFLERRRANAEYLNDKLSMLGKIIPPKEPQGRRHSWHLYTVRLRGANAGKRNKVVDRLRAKNIEATVYYETPVHVNPLYKDMPASKRSGLMETEKAARQIFQLPVHPNVEESELEFIAETVRRVIT